MSYLFLSVLFASVGAVGQLHAMNAEAEGAQQQLQQQLQQRQQQLAAIEAELKDNASLMVRRPLTNHEEAGSVPSSPAITERRVDVDESVFAAGID